MKTHRLELLRENLMEIMPSTVSCNSKAQNAVLKRALSKNSASMLLSLLRDRRYSIEVLDAALQTLCMLSGNIRERDAKAALLLQHGATVDFLASTSLHDILTGDDFPPEIIKRVLQRRLDAVNTPNEEGVTPLVHLLTQNQCTSEKCDERNHNNSATLTRLQLLLKCGVDVSLPSKCVREEKHIAIMPLQAACMQHSNIAIIHALLDADAGPEQLKEVPLHSLVCENFDERLIELRLQNGDDADERDADGMTPLWRVVALSKGWEPKQWNLTGENWIIGRQVRALVAGGADINQRYNGVPLVHAAVRRVCVPLLQLLLELGADVNALDANGHDALHCWAELVAQPNCHYNQYKMPIHGAPPEHKRRSAALDWYACPKRCAYGTHLGNVGEIITELLITRCNLTTTDGAGETAIHKLMTRCKAVAVKIGVLQCAPSHWRDVNGDTPLHLALYECDARHKNINTQQHCESGDCDLIEICAFMPLNINAVNKHGRTPLHVAAASGRAIAVERLLDRNDIKAGAVDSHGNTALHLAAARGFDSCVRSLLAHCDVNAVNKDKDTALHIAVSRGYEDVVEALLMVNKIDFDKRGALDRTPLQLTACTHQCTCDGIARRLHEKREAQKPKSLLDYDSIVEV